MRDRILNLAQSLRQALIKGQGIVIHIKNHPDPKYRKRLKISAFLILVIISVMMGQKTLYHAPAVRVYASDELTPTEAAWQKQADLIQKGAQGLWIYQQTGQNISLLIKGDDFLLIQVLKDEPNKRLYSTGKMRFENDVVLLKPDSSLPAPQIRDARGLLPLYQFMTYGQFWVHLTPKGQSLIWSVPSENERAAHAMSPNAVAHPVFITLQQPQMIWQRYQKGQP
jgi:hypothetical protein